MNSKKNDEALLMRRKRKNGKPYQYKYVGFKRLQPTVSYSSTQNVISKSATAQLSQASYNQNRIKQFRLGFQNTF